jgi:hypothetical protein
MFHTLNTLLIRSVKSFELTFKINCNVYICVLIHMCMCSRLVWRGQLYSIGSPFGNCVVHGKEGFWWGLRELSYGKVNLVIKDGKTKFETHEVEAPRKDKWKTKKRLKMQRKREKEKRKAANRRDPRRLGVKGKKKKQKFANPEERIKFKINNVSIVI